MRAGELVLVGLAVLLVAEGARARPTPRPPAQLPPTPKGGELDPYIPTPYAVVQRANALLSVLPLGDEKIEADPTGKYSRVVYRAEWHDPSPAIPRKHKGISVYRPHARTE